MSMKNVSKKKDKIVLIGMPGAGKTTLGKIIAKKIGFDFYDADEYVERKTGESIPAIFEKYGEKYFRDIESECLKDLSKKSGAVIATGGGAVEREENMQYFVNNSIIVHVDRDLEDIANADHSNRPLLKDIDNLKKIYERRKNLYKKYADIKLYTDKKIER